MMNSFHNYNEIKEQGKMNSYSLSLIKSNKINIFYICIFREISHRLKLNAQISKRKLIKNISHLSKNKLKLK